MTILQLQLMRRLLLQINGALALLIREVEAELRARGVSVDRARRSDDRASV